MSSGRNDIRLIELKDTISQLNQTIRVQTEMIKDLRKTIEEHHASDEKEGSDHFKPAGRDLISESKAVWSFQ